MPDPCPSAAVDRDRVIAADLPPPDTRRWNPKRKAQVVRAIESGVLTHQDACRLYRMAIEELLGWERARLESGERGLRVTKRMRPRVDPHDPAWLL